MILKKIGCLCFICFGSLSLLSQATSPDSARIIQGDMDSIPVKQNGQVYDLGNGNVYIYEKPKHFSFITRLPKDLAGMAKAPFQKKSIKPLLWLAGTTTLLIFADQDITDGVVKFSENIHLSAEENYKEVWSIKLGGKDVRIIRAPQNINTALYQLGQGFPSLLIGLGLITYGKVHNDYRAISTANQLAESFLLMGFSTQVIKRITGRQTPEAATRPGGKWNFFPSFNEYQDHTPYYDAFPSGHLATLMNSVTILSENYPEKKWIKPVGYSIIGLVGYSMINNKVHWASDYPLAIALGYLSAKQVVKNSRTKINSNGSVSLAKNRSKTSLQYTFNYVNGVFVPGIIYKL